MSWLFRLLDHLLGRSRAAEANGEDPKWVEPSNAITRAILSGNIGGLIAQAPLAAPTSVELSAPALEPGIPVSAPAPAFEPAAPAFEPAAAELDDAPARPAAAIVTRTARRLRRRRATRAA